MSPISLHHVPSRRSWSFLIPSARCYSICHERYLLLLQSTALAMEPRHAPFPTTVGFRSTSGFAVALPPSNDFTCFLPLAEKVGQAHAEVESVGLEAQQPQELSVVVEAEGAAHVTAGKPKSASVSPAPSVNVPPTPDAQENANHVGWRGLLEISQHSGSSGVLGARAGAVVSKQRMDCIPAYGQPMFLACIDVFLSFCLLSLVFVTGSCSAVQPASSGSFRAIPILL